jgi:hypothetical protein
MLESFISQSRSVLDRHIAFSSFVPVAFALASGATLLGMYRFDFAPVWAALTGPEARVAGQLLVLVIVVTLATVLSMTLAHLQGGVVGLWTGTAAIWAWIEPLRKQLRALPE